MKVILVLMVLVAAGVFLVYQFGIKGFDPAKQAEEFQLFATDGKTWKELTARYVPKRFQGIDVDEEGNVAYSAESDFELADFDAAVTQSGLPKHGFILHYNFSEEHRYLVYFDGEGKIESVQQAFKMSDLLAK